METNELGDLRHGLKNVMTALRGGCVLLESRFGDEPEVMEILEEMCAELARGAELLGRLRDIELTRVEPDS